MFARHVSIRLRADSIPRFIRVITSEVVPLLREQKGFLDQIIFLSPDRPEALVITFWDDRESEEAFDRTLNPEVTRSLSEVIEGSPKVERFEVINLSSTVMPPSQEAAAGSRQATACKENN
ncbi:MAG TPA: antibiotic biosynthesis monooxygenase [Blastocatellia bacterium]|nr:antibiotic biosynthesis monooxygenase [Blastocatellia bacterium]